MSVRIAMAALIRRDEVLLAHRHPERQWYPNCWDLIGGHIEAGETPEDAVRRECREEVGVTLTQLRPATLTVADPNIEAHAFVVTGWQGHPSNLAPAEHDALGWFRIDGLAGLTFADELVMPWLTQIITDHSS